MARYCRFDVLDGGVVVCFADSNGHGWCVGAVTIARGDGGGAGRDGRRVKTVVRDEGQAIRRA
eukprot:scaffold46160_cov42-Cyclotella_meneghiniana.AAC.5